MIPRVPRVRARLDRDMVPADLNSELRYALIAFHRNGVTAQPYKYSTGPDDVDLFLMFPKI